QYTGSGAAYDIEIVGEFGYLADWGRGLVILNVSDPYNVREITHYTLSGACVHVSFLNNYIYLTDHYSPYTALRIIDVSNPSNPILVGSDIHNGIDYWNPVGYGNKVFICNHGLGGGELRILDVSQPSNVALLGVFDERSNIFSSFIDGSRAYLADYERGLNVVDINNPSNPRKIAQFVDGGHSFDVEVVENIAFVADGEDGLEIIRILI
ncbi:MAG: LVIVD repeat-containing protein, partial [Candidatus Thorarchaeota archaeon]